MSATTQNPGMPAGQPWQPAPTAVEYAPLPGPAGAQTASAPGGSVLRRWPVWAQNTALAVGAVAVLLVVFFAGFFTAQAVQGGSGAPDRGQLFEPQQQFGGGSGSDGSGNGFGGGFDSQPGTSS